MVKKNNRDKDDFDLVLKFSERIQGRMQNDNCNVGIQFSVKQKKPLKWVQLQKLNIVCFE